MSEISFALAGRRVWVAGHGGMVGSALMRRLAGLDCELLIAERAAVDLRRQDEVESWMDESRPEAIFLPHRNYRRLNAEIEGSDCFSGYRRVVDRSASPLHIRRDLAGEFLQCAVEVERWQGRCSSLPRSLRR